MLSHEFGIMDINPRFSQNYNSYEPKKYNCIYINDEYIEPYAEKFLSIKCYWHSLSRAEKGLAYYGITVIEPKALYEFIKIIDEDKNLEV